MKIQRRVCRNEKRESTGQFLAVSKVRSADHIRENGTIVTDPGEAQGFGYVSHFATCEYAQTFRRK